MMEVAIVFLLYWFACFSGGYAIPTLDVRGFLLMALFYTGGLTIFFYTLAVGSMNLHSSLPSSSEVGAIGLFAILFYGSSLGFGYIVGRFVENRR